MGLIEDLRIQRGMEEAEAAKQAEIATRQRAESEAEQARQRAEREARVAALHSSAVPELAEEFAGLLKKPAWGSSISPSIKIDLERTSKTYDESTGGLLHHDTLHVTTYEKRSISIEGQVDGSVRIGDRTLSAADARIRNVVETALEHAYKNPTVIQDGKDTISENAIRAEERASRDEARNAARYPSDPGTSHT